jgi:hypothetical protein
MCCESALIYIVKAAFPISAELTLFFFETLSVKKTHNGVRKYNTIADPERGFV